MKKFKVCILTAGIGSRSFDRKINKAILPLDKKAVISHIIEKFNKNQIFVIALGHNGDQVKQYLFHAHPKTQFEFVNVDNYFNPGCGPGYSLLCCEKKLNSPFIFFSSDTIVLENIKTPSENWLGVSPVKNTENYCTLKASAGLVTSLEDKTINDNKLAWIGLAGIKDHKIFFSNLKRNLKITKDEFQISNGLKGLIPKKLKIYNYTWYDTGSIDSFLITKEAFEKGKKMDFSKPEEVFYIVGDKVIKLFLDEKKTFNLKLRWNKIKKITPKNIKFTKNVLSYKLHPGFPVYQLLDNEITLNVINFLEKNLWNKKNFIKDENFFKNCLSFYKEKTLKRIKLFNIKNNFQGKKFYINGTKVEKLEHYLKKIDWEFLSKGIESNFHGDLQFDNIIYDPRKKIFKLIDWRPEFNGSTKSGDLYYDLAKLYAGTLMSYQEIKKGNFKFEKVDNKVFYDFSYSNSLKQSQLIIEKYFNKMNYNFDKIKLISALIFVNMSPLHSSPFSEMLYFHGLIELKKLFDS